MSSKGRSKPDFQAELIRWLPHLITIIFILGVTKAVVLPLRSGVSWMALEEDDFFYYLKIAQNLAHGAGSTFNGIVPTNGYHPLWLLVLTAVSFVSAGAEGIVKFLAVAIFTSTIVTYFLARTIIRLSQVGEILSSALAVYIAIYSMHLYTGGMEVILTIPLMLGLLVLVLRTSFWQDNLFHSAFVGCLVSATVLSRLDTAIFATLLFAAIVVYPTTRRLMTRRVLAGLALGLLPLALYFLSNQFWFHTWLPVSGMAKQLKTDRAFSPAVYNSLFTKTGSRLLTLVPIPLAVLLLPALWRQLTAMQRIVCPVVLIFPFVYLSVLSFLSDWQIWDWYFYSFRVALCIAFMLFCLWRPLHDMLRSTPVGIIVALVLCVYALNTGRPAGTQVQMLEVGEFVREFSMTHRGIYAMGDRAGIVGYLLPEPLVQTEGLVMDREFLSHIRREVPLREVLRRYNVRYYIATTYPPYTEGCISIAEPYQAGPHSPHMRATFCEPPVAIFRQGKLRTSIYDLAATP